MSKISNFESFINEERQDLSIHRRLEEMFEQLFSLFTSQYCDKDLNNPKYYSNDKWFMAPVSGFVVTPFFICVRPNEPGGSHAGFMTFNFKGKKNVQIPGLILGGYNPDNELEYHTFMRSFTSFKEIIIHELAHFLDYLKLGRQPQTSDLSKLSLPEYYNRYVERNAYYLQGVHNIIKKIKDNKSILSSFDRFKSHFLHSSDFTGSSSIKSQLVEFFENLTPDNKKKFIKRLYLLYQDIKLANSI